MRRAWSLSFAFLLLAGSHAFAQQQAVPSSQRTDRQALLNSFQAFADSLSSPPDYIREVFRYPRFGRLNPVEPPTTVAGGVAFPDVLLSGIIYDAQYPERSAAIVRVRDASSVHGFTRLVVQVGDTIDQYRVAVIEPGRVLVDVYFYGGVKRIELPRASSPNETFRSDRRTGAPGSSLTERKN